MEEALDLSSDRLLNNNNNTHTSSLCLHSVNRYNIFMINIDIDLNIQECIESRYVTVYALPCRILKSISVDRK